jgi:hypothetical protein
MRPPTIAVAVLLLAGCDVPDGPGATTLTLMCTPPQGTDRGRKCDFVLDGSGIPISLQGHPIAVAPGEHKIEAGVSTTNRTNVSTYRGETRTVHVDQGEAAVATF